MTYTNAFCLNYVADVTHSGLSNIICNVHLVPAKHIKRIVCLSLSKLNYANRLKSLGLVSVELRRLHQDLLCTCKILFGKLQS